jgi:kelch-like protein 10
LVTNQVKNHPYVNGDDGCRPLVIDTLRFLYDLEIITEKTQEVITPELARPRIPHEVMFAIGGWSGGSPTSAIETYDTRADRWVQVGKKAKEKNNHERLRRLFIVA